jgi:hypothetical protein
MALSEQEKRQESLRQQFYQDNFGSAPQSTYENFKNYLSGLLQPQLAPASFKQSPDEEQLALEARGLQTFSALARALITAAKNGTPGVNRSYQSFPGVIADGAPSAVSEAEALIDAMIANPENKEANRLKNALLYAFKPTGGSSRKPEDKPELTPAPRPEPTISLPRFRPPGM